MGLAFGPENIPTITSPSTTSIQLAATNQNQLTRVQVGGQTYTTTSAITLNTGGTGANGLDTGTLGGGGTYYVYAIAQQSTDTLALVASLNGPSSGPTMPSGYGTAYKAIGSFVTDPNSAIINTALGISAGIPGTTSVDSTGTWYIGSANAVMGPLASATYANGSQNLIIGAGQNGDNGFLILVGGPTSDNGTVGRVQFAHPGSVNGLKRVAQIECERTGGSNNSATLYFNTADTSGNIQQRMSIDHNGTGIFNGVFNVAGRLGGTSVGGSGTGTVSLGVNIYQGNSGGTIMVFASSNTAAGANTSTAVYIIRAYFDSSGGAWASGAGTVSQVVALNSVGYTFSIDGSGNLLVAAGQAGNHSYKVFINK